ncbi:hypothetical protein M3182_06270 [Mesobacillus maritimus]|nr:hypothetical protein [Mesobacillus maritimus]MCM3585349.1 hypothetical protein [Mesobacillus maritimus]MCM3668231.1 hypothetical protein [Mesobacillus maritimus]
MFNLPLGTFIAFFPWPILFIGSAIVLYFIFKRQDEREEENNSKEETS